MGPQNTILQVIQNSLMIIAIINTIRHNTTQMRMLDIRLPDMTNIIKAIQNITQIRDIRMTQIRVNTHIIMTRRAMRQLTIRARIMLDTINMVYKQPW